MASISLESAFENFPEQTSVAAVLEELENFAAREEVASPRAHKPASTSFKWPMDSSRFLVDERRVDVSDGQAYAYESFVDEYGPEDADIRWASAAAVKSEETELPRLCSLVRKMVAACDAQEIPRVLALAHRLVDAIKAQKCVEAAAGCLSAVCTGLKKEGGELVEVLKEMVSSGPTSAARRAAAMGLAGCLKGLGLPAIKQHGIICFLEQLADAKSSTSESRQAALFTYECLFRFFGYPFEPYLVAVTRTVINAFDDQTTTVRSAAERAAACMLGNVSAVAVSKLLVVVTELVSSRSTRLKCGATTCLGFLTSCGKRALSVSLPVIVPTLAQLVNDSNNQVRVLAGSGLENIASAIPNPEISEMAPGLLGALSDPSEQTEEAIGTLMGCSYVHAVDPASLSFLMPILMWGLRDRKAETKRRSVQIVGTLVSLVQDDRDLLPYIKELDPALRLLLGDAIPDTRLFAARAFSMMLQKYGEARFRGLFEWLVEQMETSSDQTVTDGASLGLSEGLYALGIRRLEGMIPLIESKLSSPNARVRTVFFKFLPQLPIKFPEELVPYIATFNQFALQGFGDNALEVRGAALHFGVQLVQMYSGRAKELLLPVIEAALWHASPNTQEAALMLLGYLLAKLAGEDELMLNPDEMQGADAAVNKVSAKDALRITEALGQPTHDHLLCTVCVLRSHPEEAVSNMAGRVIRSVVEKVQAKVDEMFPQLMAMVLPMMLAQSSPAQAVIGARCLGSLAATNKVLERVMTEITPLCAGLQEGESKLGSDSYTGLMRCLHQIASEGNDKKLLGYQPLFTEAVLAGLQCGYESAEGLAGELFLALHERVKMGLLPALLPPLVEGVKAEHPRAEGALRALLVLKVKGGAVLKAYQAYLKAHPTKNDTLDAVLQAHTGTGEVKKKTLKVTKKAAKHDFVEPGKAKVKKTSKKLTKAEIAIQEEMQAMKKAEALGNVRQAEAARLRKKGLA